MIPLTESHATNVIVLVAFGIGVHTITNPNHDFRIFGREIFQTIIYSAFRRIQILTAPILMECLHNKSADSDVEK